MVTLEKLDNGNLKIVLNDKDELMDVIARGQDERDALYDILERTGLIGNGWGVIFDAGLTEAPVIGEDMFVAEHSGDVTAENIWYFNEYMIEDYLAILRDKGSVIFTAHQDNKKAEEVYNVTKQDLINLLDQAFNDEEEGLLVKWETANQDSIEAWVTEKIQYL